MTTDTAAVDDSTHKCAHALCMCLISADREYCSDYCKSANEWEPCGCGHALCTPEALEEGR